MTEPVRLAKRLAEMLSCSRREAELYIEGGWVSVDGKVMQEPQYRVAQQQIVLHKDATLAPVELVTILFHHPAGQSPGVERADARLPDQPVPAPGPPSRAGAQHAVAMRHRSATDRIRRVLRRVRRFAQAGSRLRNCPHPCAIALPSSVPVRPVSP